MAWSRQTGSYLTGETAMSEPSGAAELKVFLTGWPQAQPGLKRAYLWLKERAQALPEATWSFLARPGVSHSLRFDLAPRPAGRARPVFFLVDVVGAAGELFLSVCFYEDEVSDPQDLGNAIPQGLFMETGYCFDVDDFDQEQLDYLGTRLKEAHASARGE
jgi:hypothetical protein